MLLRFLVSIARYVAKFYLHSKIMHAAIINSIARYGSNNAFIMETTSVRVELYTEHNWRIDFLMAANVTENPKYLRILMC